MRFLILVLTCIVFQKNLHSQKADSIPWPNPRKAAIYSAMLPGLGQIYNDKKWKAAIVYAGFAGITTSLIVNNSYTKSYQKALNYRFDNDTNTIDFKYPNLSDASLKSERNFYRRNRDISILCLGVWYALNIIEANVDAHLRVFKTNKALSVSPLLLPNQSGLVYGFKMQYKF